MALQNIDEIFLPRTINKRAEYLDFLKEIIFSVSAMSEDLSILEYNESERNRTNVIARIEQAKLKLDILSKNL